MAQTNAKYHQSSIMLFLCSKKYSLQCFSTCKLVNQLVVKRQHILQNNIRLWITLLMKKNYKMLTCKNLTLFRRFLLFYMNSFLYFLFLQCFGCTTVLFSYGRSLFVYWNIQGGEQLYPLCAAVSPYPPWEIPISFLAISIFKNKFWIPPKPLGHPCECINTHRFGGIA